MQIAFSREKKGGEGCSRFEFGSAAAEGGVGVEEGGCWFRLALEQYGVFQLLKARYRAALALPGIRIVRRVRQLVEAPRQLVVLELGA